MIILNYYYSWKEDKDKDKDPAKKGQGTTITITLETLETCDSIHIPMLKSTRDQRGLTDPRESDSEEILNKHKKVQTSLLSRNTAWCE